MSQDRKKFAGTTPSVFVYRIIGENITELVLMSLRAP